MMCPLAPLIYRTTPSLIPRPLFLRWLYGRLYLSDGFNLETHARNLFADKGCSIMAAFRQASLVVLVVHQKPLWENAGTECTPLLKISRLSGLVGN